jgi:hypothetical protein
MKPGAFEAAFNAALLAVATEKVEKARATVEGITKEARKLADVFVAFDNAISKLAATDTLFAPFRQALLTAGLRHVADDVIPSHGKIAQAVAEVQPAIPNWRRRSDWFIGAVVAREAEVADWPTPTLDNLTTVYCPETPQRLEAASADAIGNPLAIGV